MNAEAYYQNKLLHSLINPLNDSITNLNIIGLGKFGAEEGLKVYQNNTVANAVNALSVLYPSIKVLLNEVDFYALCKAYWLDCPPSKGDWSYYNAQNGHSLGHWIRHSNYGGIDTALPFLADLANLDDALNTAQDAADLLLDINSLNLLTKNPKTLTLLFQPSVHLLNLSYDIIDFKTELIQNHSKTTSTPVSLTNLMHKFEAVLSKKYSHTALIHRIHWQSYAKIITVADKTCIDACLNGATLHQAYQLAYDIDSLFSFSDWITQLLNYQCLHRIVENTA